MYPEDFTSEPDGTWRGCSPLSGIGLGNIGFFFAMSTQQPEDVQTFEPGAAFQIPANAVIMGNLHLLNVTPAPLETSMTFEVHTLEAAEVVKPLTASTYSIQGLAVPPLQRSNATMDCAWDEPGAEVHYILSHYHQWGTEMVVETGAETIFSGVGGSRGERMDPPPILGDNIRMTCNYDNDQDRILRWENAGSGEMCVLEIFTTGVTHFGAELAGCTTSGAAIYVP